MCHYKVMITLQELKFTPHPHLPSLTNASKELPNGIFLSVIKDNSSYEVAMFRQGDMIRLGAYQDVLCYQSDSQVNELIKESQINLASFLAKAQARKELETQLYS